MKKHVTLSDFLTPDEIERARKIYKRGPLPGEPANWFNIWIVDEIIEPNMDRINLSLAQVNNSRFLGYLVEYVLMKNG